LGEEWERTSHIAIGPPSPIFPFVVVVVLFLLLLLLLPTE
jgi:hypothetical protein